MARYPSLTRPKIERIKPAMKRAAMRGKAFRGVLRRMQFGDGTPPTKEDGSLPVQRRRPLDFVAAFEGISAQFGGDARCAFKVPRLHRR